MMNPEDNHLRIKVSQDLPLHLLVIIGGAPAARKGGFVLVDKKTASGLAFYAQSWRGRTRAIFREAAPESIQFGEIIDTATLPYEIVMLEERAEVSAVHVEDAAVVLASGDNYLNFQIADLCIQLHVPLVYVIEHIPETRHRIIWVSDGSVIKKLKSSVWTLLSERQRIRAFKKAAALQANGTPAARHYAKISSKILTYFDTRMQHIAFATSEELEKRNARLLSRAELRLVFTGRLEKLKGADHLVPLAVRLRATGLRFRFDVFGPGEQAIHMRQKIENENLSDIMTIHDPLDFNTELVPWLRKNADIFICCHRQSDPSCTYMETLGCGLPIAGYMNRAFAGILELGDVGWGVDMDDIGALANCIQAADIDRKAIAIKSANAVKLSSSHSFERTFQARIDQLSQIVNLDR